MAATAMGRGRPEVTEYRTGLMSLLMSVLMGKLGRFKALLLASAEYWDAKLFTELEATDNRTVVAQGIIEDGRAILVFFALLVIGIFVLSEIDTNLSVSSGNYSDASNATSGGFESYVDIATVLPIVIVGGLMLAILFRVI